MSDSGDDHFAGGSGDDFALSDDEGPSFTLAVDDQGADGGFHTRNKPGMQQRQMVTDRSKADYKVKCRATAFVHGLMDGPDGEEDATLMVYDFHFLRYKSSRIKYARLVFEFKGTDGDAEEYLVRKISPDGQFFMMETTQTEKVTRGANATAGAGVLGADLSAGYKWETTTEAQTSDSIALTGETESDDWGNENVVKFTLSENETRKTGVPSHLRVAILLRRPNDEPFHCVPKFEVQTDFMSSMKGLFSRRDVDDPVVMNPAKPPLNKLKGVEIDPDNLGALDLNEIFKCTFNTEVEGAVKYAKTTVKGDEKGVVEAEVTQVKESLVPAS